MKFRRCFESDYREWLKMLLHEHQSRNPNYSLRAFSRDLGIYTSALSSCMNKQSHFSQPNAIKISNSLGLTVPEATIILEQIDLKTVSYWRNGLCKAWDSWNLLANSRDGSLDTLNYFTKQVRHQAEQLRVQGISEFLCLWAGAKADYAESYFCRLNGMFEKALIKVRNSLTTLRELSSIGSRIGLLEDLSSVETYLAYLQENQGDLLGSLQSIERVLKTIDISRDLDDGENEESHWSYCLSLHTLGCYHLDLEMKGNARRAFLLAFEEAKSYCEKYGQHNKFARESLERSYRGLGIFHFRIGEYHTAITNFENSLNLLKIMISTSPTDKRNYTIKAEICLWLANCEFNNGNFHKFRAYFNESKLAMEGLNPVEKKRTSINEHILKYNLTAINLLRKVGENDEARILCKKSIEIVRQLPELSIWHNGLKFLNLRLHKNLLDLNVGTKESPTNHLSSEQLRQQINVLLIENPDNIEWTNFLQEL